MNHIATNQREDEILRELYRAGGSCRVSVLAHTLGVTLETIRRNVRTLQERNIVRKVHGGVHLVEDIQEPTLATRLEVKVEVKERLANAVADIIGHGDSVFLDIGSTTAYVARALSNHSELFVVTNSVYVASQLASRNGNRVFIAGGELRPHDAGAFGAESHDLIKRLNVRFAVLSVGAINAEDGFMLHDLDEANLAKVAIDNAQVGIVVSDAQKFGKRAPIKLDEEAKINLLVTEQDPPEDIAAFLKAHDIDVLVAK
ncbi:MAG: DeoR/GlpR family DNA-binding transcription regulator [Pseudomonadota bacterium]